VNGIVKDSGVNAGITSLSTDGKLVYGTGYDFGKGGNFEGTFAATSAGSLVWLEDCHGDTYSSAPVGPVIYTVSHAHSCSTVGGFPEVKPRVAHRALAFTTARTGTLHHWTGGYYADFGGRPAPTLLIWFPDLTIGTFTGQSQAAWSVAANSSYVVLGGEFPSVNGVKQQGLVRFAISSHAPNKQGPRAKAADLGVQVTPTGTGQLRVTYRTTWDRDNELLTYTVKRSDRATPLTVVPLSSRFWRISTRAYTDSGLTSGRTYTYQVTVKDPFGNAVSSARVSATAP
jgi:hypothetical protein